ncbi:hypothetical protein [Corynebacterium sp. Marseille-P4321]|uniref:hypothetical protein n=1 Tax=Corynebacterium sp. Marseille-P4321 TaxID=2736603 RepID=UPI0020CA5148|nr:hypothetical protein [Corynebacterium sp. Marseille-P4321]
MRAARWLFAYGVVLVAAVTWPFLVPGEAFLHRDMVVFDGMALTRAALGFGDLPARNVPQDALLAVVPHPVLVLRVVMVGAAAAAAWAGWRLGRTNAGKAAAMTVAVFNPFVVERMLQGQWSLAVAAWLVPAAALGWRERARRGRCGALGGVADAEWGAGGGGVRARAAGGGDVRGDVRAVGGSRDACGWGRARARVGGGVRAARGGARGHVGGVARFGRGVERGGGAGVAGGGLRAVRGGVVRAARAGVARGAAGVAARGGGGVCGGGGVVGWVLAPLVERVPGGGLLRDAQKWLILALPAFVAAAGALEARVAKAAAACALLQVPDAPVALATLTPSQLEVVEVDHGGRDVLFEGASSLVLIDGTPTVNPTFKAMNVVEPGALVVDGVVVDAPNARWVAAQGADVGTLRALGVGLVVHADGSVTDTGAPAKPLPPAGVALFALWLTVPLLALCPKSQKSSARR